MKLSYSISKNILETTVGSLINKFYLSKRRDTLFFGDIFINYIKECEDAGYKEEMRRIGQKWSILCMKNLIPTNLKKLPPTILLNTIIKNVWINLGLMSNYYVNKKGNIIRIRTENEAITEMIGKNYFSVGLFIGNLNIVFDSQIHIIEFSQTKRYSEYILRMVHGKCPKIKESITN